MFREVGTFKSTYTVPRIKETGLAMSRAGPAIAGVRVFINAGDAPFTDVSQD